MSAKTTTMGKGEKTPFAKTEPTPEQPAPQAKAQVENDPDTVNFEDEAGAGLGGLSVDDIKIPFLTILQSNSPQLTEGGPKYNKDARAGQVVNTVTNEIVEARKSQQKFITVVPIHYNREYIEWKPRVGGTGGGLVQVHRDKAILSQTKKGTGNDATRDFLPNGNTVETTAKWFVMWETEKGMVPCVIAMARTLLKHSKAWMTKINSQRMKRADGVGTYMPPIYSRRWHLSTVPESKDGKTWFVWDTEEAPVVRERDTYLEVKGVHMAINSGQLALPASSEEALDVPEEQQGAAQSNY